MNHWHPQPLQKEISNHCHSLLPFSANGQSMLAWRTALIWLVPLPWQPSNCTDAEGGEVFSLLPQASSFPHLWSLDLPLSTAFSCSAFLYCATGSFCLCKVSVKTLLVFLFSVLILCHLLNSSSGTSRCHPRAGKGLGTPAAPGLGGSTHPLQLLLSQGL